MLLDFQEWAEEPTVIQIHTIVAILGIFIGGYAMIARKGTARHKLMGRLFGLMAVVTALTSFFIHEIRSLGLWSPIHLLSIFTLIIVWRGVADIRAGRVKAHQRKMQGIYLSGFVIAAAFTLMPGRLPYEVFLEGMFERLTGSVEAAENLALVFPTIAIPLSMWIFAKNFRRG